MRKCVHLDGKLILRDLMTFKTLNANKLAIRGCEMLRGIPGEFVLGGRSQKGSSLVDRQNNYGTLREAEASPTLGLGLIDRIA